MTKMGALAGVGLAALMAASGAHAQSSGGNEIEEVVVTAQKRAENLQDVPIAITALTGETLQNQRVGNLLGLTGLSPGLQIKTDDNAANPRIFIRGVGVNDFNPSTASAVGIYVDGVYVASPLAQLASFYDLQQVEVLRGPQGTLYGRNTTGGAINVTTKKPTDSFQADAAVDYGNFHAVNAQGGVGGPIPMLGDAFSFRVAGIYNKDDGYTLNRLTGNHGNDADRWGLRAALRYKPDDKLTADLTLSLNQSRGGSILAYNRGLIAQTAAAAGPYDASLGYNICKPAYYTSGDCTNVLGYANTSGNLYQGDYQFEGKDILKLFGAASTISYDFGPVTLVSVTGYQRAARDDWEETDANPIPIITARYVAREETTSQELRLQSNGQTKLRWLGGLYFANDYLNNNSKYDILAALRNPTPANPTGADLANSIALLGWPLHQSSKSYAAFGQADYDVSDRLTLTLGLRYSMDEKQFHYVSEAEGGLIPIFTFDKSKTFRSLSGRLGVRYKLNEDTNVYATYNRGYKSGGFFSGQTTEPLDLGPYQDEKVNAYEAGVKSTLFDRRLRANISTFYYDYRDLQVYTTVQRGLQTVQLFTNASAAKIYGADAEIEATPAQGLDLSLGLSLLSAEYKDFVSLGRVYSGNTLPSAPKASVNGSVHYSHPLPVGEFVGQADFTYRTKVYFDTANTERLSDGARTFVNAQLGWRLQDGKYEMGVWGKNIFDETNISDITPIPGLGFDVISVGQPRTYGVYLRAKY